MARLGVTVQEIVNGIGNAFPYSDAEAWDRVGLLVGDESAEVTGILFALEPRLETIELARSKGANVIVTHHPVYVDPPLQISAHGPYAGRVVKAAIEAGISLINAHTNLDVSEDARRSIGEKLGLVGFHAAMSACDIKEEAQQSRYAALWDTTVERSLAEIAHMCEKAYHATPTVYGEPHKRITTIMTVTGGGGEHTIDALAEGADVLITGEVKYHDAIAAQQCGVAVIELGHDVSEWPLVPLLKEAVLAQTFMRPENLFDAPPAPAWWTENGAMHV